MKTFHWLTITSLWSDPFLSNSLLFHYHFTTSYERIPINIAIQIQKKQSGLFVIIIETTNEFVMEVVFIDTNLSTFSSLNGNKCSVDKLLSHIHSYKIYCNSLLFPNRKHSVLLHIFIFSLLIVPITYTQFSDIHHHTSTSRSVKV